MEAKNISDFRRQELLSMGFSKEQAARLSETEIGIHEIKDLLAKGCTVPQAYRILRP